MKILIVSSINHVTVQDTEILPRTGDKVDMFYMPYPTVISVLLYPSKETLSNVKNLNCSIDAIVTVE